MEKPASIVEGLLSQIEDYGKTSFELAKLRTIQKLIPAATVFTSNVIVLSVVSLFVLLLNIGIGMWLGDVLGKPWYGFMAISAFYLFLAVLLRLKVAKWLRKPISRFIIKQTLH